MTLHVDYSLDIEELPRECIEDCSASGSVDEAVTYWREELGFTVNRERTLRCLQGYGAWEPEELAALSDEALAEKVLWLACCNFGEFIVYAEREDVNPFNPPEGFDPAAGSDIFVLE